MTFEIQPSKPLVSRRITLSFDLGPPRRHQSWWRRLWLWVRRLFAKSPPLSPEDKVAMAMAQDIARMEDERILMELNQRYP